MKISSDYKDLLSIFNAAGVRYPVAGGYAVMIHTEPRYTKDLDIWIEPSGANAQALFEALARFGAPLNPSSRCFTRSAWSLFASRSCPPFPGWTLGPPGNAGWSWQHIRSLQKPRKSK